MVDRFKHVICGHDYLDIPNFPIHNPSLSEIPEFGEEKYFYMIQVLLSKPQDMMVFFDDMGIDYETVDEYQFFLSNFMALPKILSQIKDNIIIDDNYLPTAILFGDVDISKFIFTEDIDTNEMCLFHEELNILLKPNDIAQMLDYIRQINNVEDTKKRNFSSDFVKKEIIDYERTKLRRRKRENKPFESILSVIISRLVNTAGFKYDYSSVLSMKISQFYDSLKTLQGISEHEHITNAIYAGTIQYSKVSDKSVLNWIQFNTN